ncbi:MAG: hypothetical protein AW09_002393 [Candidatus Accumulibacter phosphatis]|uniref:Uncharacterized protein n=1 Tax=Candidatus Accumulibacter phosphatis TaxID=327160 RepID=A0A080LUX7_9PROT|nr:MAG: hypothetical protein AW09_002393 [Candidatus Accumulibacter phosphatis]
MHQRHEGLAQQFRFGLAKDLAIGWADEQKAVFGIHLDYQVRLILDQETIVFPAFLQGGLRPLALGDVDVQPQDGPCYVPVLNGSDDVTDVSLFAADSEKHVSFDDLPGKGSAIVALPKGQLLCIIGDFFRMFSNHISPTLSTGGVLQNIAMGGIDDEYIERDAFDGGTKPHFALP